MGKEDLQQFENMFDGKDPKTLITEFAHKEPEKAKERLLAYKDAFRKLQQIRVNGDKVVVISDKEDELISHTRGYGDKGQRPEDYLESFSEFVKTHMNDIAALNIICTKPGDLTRKDLVSLKLTLAGEEFSDKQLNTAISQMTNVEISADIISIIRRYALGEALVSHEERVHGAVEKLRKNHSFTKQEENWLKRVENYLKKESVLNVDVFDEDSRFRAEGGFKRFDKVFHNNLRSIVKELNQYL